MEELMEVQVQEVNENKENKKKKQKMDYVIEGNVAKFTTSQGIEFMVDAEDADRVSKYSWCVNNHGYVVGRVNGKVVSLHRFILGVLDSEDRTLIVDHRDFCKVNNCRSNLRICTNQENQRNRKDVKGIYKNPNNTYQAYIAVDGEKIHLGTYESEQMARAVRLIAEKEYFGEFSPNVDLYEDAETLKLYEEAMASIEYLHKNECRIDEDENVVYVTVSGKGITKEFVINLDDYEKIKRYKWYMITNGLIEARVDGEHQKLTRVLLGLKKGDRSKRVRFIDGDNLNYRRNNLEVIECKVKTKN